MKETAGLWDKKDWPLYFLACNMRNLIVRSLGENDPILIAVNELSRDEAAQSAEGILTKQSTPVLLDSGVYWLATEHARKHNISMDEALALAPERIDNFDWLLTLYLKMVARYESRLWGYIEIDQGGRENKIKTRTMLEAKGLRPIPVYHPLNDGWDYFDELAQQYDRICLGNIVMADKPSRRRILATMWERRRKYPHLWIHGLGMTPRDMTLAYMMNSFDSSSWLTGVRFGETAAATINLGMAVLMNGFDYRRDLPIEHEGGHTKGTRLCAYSAVMLGHSLRAYRKAIESELGADVGLFDVDHG